MTDNAIWKLLTAINFLILVYLLSKTPGLSIEKIINITSNKDVNTLTLKYLWSNIDEYYGANKTVRFILTSTNNMDFHPAEDVNDSSIKVELHKFKDYNDDAIYLDLNTCFSNKDFNSLDFTTQYEVVGIIRLAKWSYGTPFEAYYIYCTHPVDKV